MARSGAFGTTLDPFGKSWGGLGRYNVTGDTIQSLAELEAYAVAVAWGNGVASDEAYLESLRKLRDLEQPGSRGYITAQNKLEDAEYTIGRNKIAAGINAATGDQERLTALRALLNFDRERLTKMTPDNEQYREQIARIASTEGTIRQTEYGILVELVNNGQGTFEQLLDMARRNLALSAGQPDQADWEKAVVDVEERMWDEKLSIAMQDYEHERASGEQVLALMDQRLRMLMPGSPGYLAMERQREDFAESVRRTDNQERDTEAYNKWQSGKMSDASWLAYLSKRVSEEKPGSAEQAELKTRLSQYTFSLGEDKLRYQLDAATPGSSAWNSARQRLIGFYTSYQATLNRGSKEWRTVDLAIRNLRAAGASSGGTGGNSGGSVTTSKNIPTDTTLSAVSNAPGAPPGLKDLLRINPKNNGSMRWFKINRDNILTAVNNGSKTWRFVDLDGKMYDVPLAGAMVREIDQLYVEHATVRLGAAKTFNARTVALGELDRAIEQQGRHGGQLTMDVYTKTFQAIETEKQVALAANRMGDYLNLVLDQQKLMAYVMGIKVNPVTGEPQEPVDITNNRNPALSGSMLDRIANDMEGMQPYQPNPNEPGYNTGGDKVLWLYGNGYLADLSRDGRTGRYNSGTYNSDQMFVYQDSTTGQIKVELVDPDTGYTIDPLTGKQVPLYMVDGSHVRVKVADNGQQYTLYQPITAPGSGTNEPANALLVKYRDKAGHPTGAGVLRTSSTRIPVMTITTTQDGEKQTWYSVDGQTWVMAPRGGVAPVLVPQLGGAAGLTIAPNGSVMVMVNGQSVPWSPGLYKSDDEGTVKYRADLLFRFWQPQDAQNRNEAGNGAPGYLMHVRHFGKDDEGTMGVDLRDDRYIRETELEALYQNPARRSVVMKQEKTAEALRRKAREDEAVELQWLRERTAGRSTSIKQVEAGRLATELRRVEAAASARRAPTPTQVRASAGLRGMQPGAGAISGLKPANSPFAYPLRKPAAPPSGPKSPYVRAPARTALRPVSPTLRPIYAPRGSLASTTTLPPPYKSSIPKPNVNTGFTVPPPKPTTTTTKKPASPTKAEREAEAAAKAKAAKTGKAVAF